VKLFKYLSIPAILLLASTGVQATILYIDAPTSSDCLIDPLCWTSDSRRALHAGDVASLTGESEELVSLYKAEFDLMTEEGPFQSLYDISWDLEDSDDPDDASGGIISWTGNELVDTEIDCSSISSCYTVVKGGRHGDPNQYIFDISGWDGIMDIVLSGFWDEDRARSAISHVAIYGVVGVVPLPAAFWLFGTALIGFVGVSRRRSV